MRHVYLSWSLGKEASRAFHTIGEEAAPEYAAYVKSIAAYEGVVRPGSDRILAVELSVPTSEWSVRYRAANRLDKEESASVASILYRKFQELFGSNGMANPRESNIRIYSLPGVEIFLRRWAELYAAESNFAVPYEFWSLTPPSPFHVLPYYEKADLEDLFELWSSFEPGEREKYRSMLDNWHEPGIDDQLDHRILLTLASKFGLRPPVSLPPADEE